MAKERKHFSILIVEDDDGHYLLMAKNLRRLGFSSKVVRFVDGEQVLDFLYERAEAEDKTKFLVILDVNMPKMDGTRVLAKIRQHPKLKSTPVIMLTSSTDQHKMYVCKALGCDDYVLKPSNAAGFAEAMNRVADTLLMAILNISEFDK
jgi:CheY-like chemotaxis protein